VTAIRQLCDRHDRQLVADSRRWPRAGQEFDALIMIEWFC